MFDDFKQKVKMIAKSKCLTYAQIAEKSGVKESTIKAFMCGATDSRKNSRCLGSKNCLLQW